MHERTSLCAHVDCANQRACMHAGLCKLPTWHVACHQAPSAMTIQRKPSSLAWGDHMSTACHQHRHTLVMRWPCHHCMSTPHACHGSKCHVHAQELAFITRHAFNTSSSHVSSICIPWHGMNATCMRRSWHLSTASRRAARMKLNKCSRTCSPSGWRASNLCMPSSPTTSCPSTTCTAGKGTMRCTASAYPANLYAPLPPLATSNVCIAQCCWLFISLALFSSADELPCCRAAQVAVH